MPPQLIDLMKLLDYSVPLGGPDVDTELHSLLDRIENVDWDLVSRQNSSRPFARQRPSFSPGRVHRGAGDYTWFNPWAKAQCSREEALLSRQYGSQTPVPIEMPAFIADPRERDLCPREPLSSRPVSPVSPTSLPADVTGVTRPVHDPVMVAGAPAGVGSRPPLRSRAPPADICQPPSEVRGLPSSASRTESLSVRPAPESEGCSLPLVPSVPPAPSSPAAPPVAASLSAIVDAVQSTGGELNSPSSPDVIKKNDDASSVYRTLLRARGINEEALQGASLTDLRVLAQLVASLPREKFLE